MLDHFRGAFLSTAAFTSKRLPYNLTTMNYITAVVMVLFHVGAMAAFFHFTWTNFLVPWRCTGWPSASASAWAITGCTRTADTRSKAFEYFLAICGTLTLEGGPIFWVATHRIHHQHSDHDGDPHTPHDGGFWAHVGWILFGEGHHNNTALMAKYAPDLGADPFYRWLNTWHFVPLIAVGLLAARARRMADGVLGHLPPDRVRSARHLAREFGDAHVGQPPVPDADDSRNSWWVALLTFGEGWHNNHHAHPVSARHGLAWYESTCPVSP